MRSQLSSSVYQKQEDIMINGERTKSAQLYDRGTVNYMLEKMSGYNKQKMVDEMTKNIVEDASIYDYDSYVDEYKEKRQQIQQEQKQKKRESVLLGKIQETMAKRQIEKSIIHEKLAEKQLQRENKQNQNKEKFVTSGFKKVLEDNKKFMEQDEIQEKYNQQHSGKSIDNFYHSIYSAQNQELSNYRPDLSSTIINKKSSQEQQFKLNETNSKLISNKQSREQEQIDNQKEQYKKEDKKQIEHKRQKDEYRSRSRSRSHQKKSRKYEKNEKEKHYRHEKYEKQEKRDSHHTNYEKEKKEKKIIKQDESKLLEKQIQIQQKNEEKQTIQQQTQIQQVDVKEKQLSARERYQQRKQEHLQFQEKVELLNKEQI